GGRSAAHRGRRGCGPDLEGGAGRGSRPRLFKLLRAGWALAAPHAGGLTPARCVCYRGAATGVVRGPHSGRMRRRRGTGTHDTWPGAAAHPSAQPREPAPDCGTPGDGQPHIEGRMTNRIEQWAAPDIRLVETTEGEVTLSIDGHQAMQAWERDLMWAAADQLCTFGSEFLEVGLGLGISALRIASNPTTRRHVVVERY